MAKKITLLNIGRMKNEGKKIVMVTAYDYPFARIMDESGVDVILVGDSLGMVVQGLSNTLSVTVDEMIYHTRAVVRGTSRAFVVIDMPFLSYQVSPVQARQSAGQMIKESGAEAVKLEGGANMAETIRALCEIDIPVMGHIGLTPQSIHRMGGYRVQGRNEAQRMKLLEDARAVEEAGAFAMVLEGMPLELAKEITEVVSIPTIGIGAGVHCDGQVLVMHDLLGILDEFQPTFVKRYAHLKDIVIKAITQYSEEVRGSRFPGEEHSYPA